MGDLRFVKTLAKGVAPLTPSQEKLAGVGAGIRLDPDRTEAAFMARQLVQCTLPHRDPGDVPLWRRKSGDVSLAIQPGPDMKTGKLLGYPYGSLPRLLLFWITTEAVRNRSKRLELGNSLSAFMRELGLIPASESGGKRSDAKRLRNQMQRLFGCRISFDQDLSRGDGTEGKRWLHMEVAPEGEYWWDPKQPAQGALWGSWIELGEKFFQAIISAPVPVDMRALRGLKRSPLALDLYSWATYRVYQVNRKGSPTFIPWKGLMQQLGTEYSSVDDFVKYAKQAFRSVRTVYPNLKMGNARGGFWLHPSLTAVASRPAKPKRIQP